MATVKTTNARELAAQFESELALRGIRVVELWFRDRRGIMELWLVTDRIGLDEERQISHAQVALRDRFPDLFIDVFVLNPNDLGELDPRALLPSDAMRVDFHDHA